MMSEQRKQQAMHALRNANAIRMGRAQLKHDLDSGACSIETILTEPPDCCANVAVLDALQWVRGIGHHSARKLARGVVSETLTLCCMGPRSRDLLIKRLQARTGVSR